VQGPTLHAGSVKMPQLRNVALTGPYAQRRHPARGGREPGLNGLLANGGGP